MALRIGEVAVLGQVDLCLPDSPHETLGESVLLRLFDGHYADRHAAAGQQVSVRRGGVLHPLVGVVALGAAPPAHRPPRSRQSEPLVEVAA